MAVTKYLAELRGSFTVKANQTQQQDLEDKMYLQVERPPLVSLSRLETTVRWDAEPLSLCILSRRSAWRGSTTSAWTGPTTPSASGASCARYVHNTRLRSYDPAAQEQNLTLLSLRPFVYSSGCWSQGPPDRVHLRSQQAGAAHAGKHHELPPRPGRRQLEAHSGRLRRVGRGRQGVSNISIQQLNMVNAMVD